MDTFAVKLPIELGQFIKLAGLTETGGQAAEAISEGAFSVNGEVETRRRHKLAEGDVVSATTMDGQLVQIKVAAR
ncbi:ribosome-associated protein [Arcanobacterium wilhelmae]|uniref:Ribosome-associated protein n=1 Tax=Arcanobacterium wilhelmae TaxID=1803177 RepID=A0ABT9N9Z8_9ACTO|nr:RNA-binding S4 domain-containing protein [Arcanobacterium wilhelmae]MDP9800236.1 ribosome-associated protein [Arcanobacterium wilhelmae]WFN89675.1 RNA-binding S4 domain-containing protein [Arcanobacterium wilhelmae]